MSKPDQLRSIPDFFRGKTLLITGATGFLGKSLVSKILSDLPDIEKMYLLIRSRRFPDGHLASAKERLSNEFQTASAYGPLRTFHGEKYESWWEDKVEAIEGDMGEINFGLSAEDLEKVRQEVQIIINSAALVKFDPPVDQSLQHNTISAKYAVEIAKSCNKAILIHVSTAFVCGMRQGRIPEEIYQPLIDGPGHDGGHRAVPVSLEEEIAEIARISEEIRHEAGSPQRSKKFRTEAIRQMRSENGSVKNTMDEQVDFVREQWIEKKLVDIGLSRAKLHGWIDTYTNMKAFGEQMIVRERGDLPTAIIRPSIIESSLSDPEPGWLDGLRMADPLIVNFGKGRLSDFPAEPDTIIDIIPVDFVSNSILAAAVHISEHGGFEIYNIATGPEISMTVDELAQGATDYFKKVPMLDKRNNPIAVLVWRYRSLGKFQRALRVKLKLLEIALWFLNSVPLKWADKWVQKIAAMLKGIKALQYYIKIYGPYTRLNVQFETGNMFRLANSLSPDDRKVFNFDTSSLNMLRYLKEIHIPGIKRYVLKLDKDGRKLDETHARGDNIDSARIGTA